MNTLNRRRLLRLSGAVAAGASALAPRAQARRPPRATQNFIILSCDGGGVRGLITALLLQNLNPGFLQKVSLFAGTSTGSVIALALAAGVPIGQVVRLYQSMADCKTIFTPFISAAEVRAAHAQLRAALQALPPQTGPAPQIDWQKILQLVLKAAEEMAFPKYQSTGLQALLAANLPVMTLAQLASQTGKYVVVPSFQINSGNTTGSWQPVLFHNLPNVPLSPDLSGTRLVDTAMCSAAAPTFFPPHDIAEGAFVDGGLAANNPCAAAIAAVLASSLPRQMGLTPESITAVSIGTGNVANSYPPSDAIFPFGILGPVVN
jgi:patatin-like phospholipase/acyl hydrolase